jgi:hypothetical protein
VLLAEIFDGLVADAVFAGNVGGGHLPDHLLHMALCVSSGLTWNLREAILVQSDFQ